MGLKVYTEGNLNIHWNVPAFKNIRKSHISEVFEWIYLKYKQQHEKSCHSLWPYSQKTAQNQTKQT